MTPTRTFVVALAVVLAGIWLAPLAGISQLVSDDAYYYLKTAGNILAGEGSTFDGINPSNGYHPLWMLVTLAAHSLTTDVEIALRWLLSAQAVALAGAAALLVRLLPAGIGRWAGLTAFLSFGAPALLTLNGLETTLLMFSILLVLAADQRFAFLSAEATPWQQRALLGVLLALVCLTRLDSVFLLLGITLVALLCTRAGATLTAHVGGLIARFLPTVVVFIALLTPYFAWNIACFDSLTPLSGALKSSFPDPGFRWRFMLEFIHIPLALLVASGWFAYRVAQQGQRDRSALIPLALALGCLLHLLWTMAFMTWGTFQWHMAGYIPVIALAAGEIGHALFGQLRRSQQTGLAALAVALCLAFNALLIVLKDGHHNYRLEAARWTDANLDAGAVIGLRDAGVYGQFSKRSVVNLDGLINGYAFAQAVRAGELRRYFDDIQMTHVADAYTDCDYREKTVRMLGYNPLPETSGERFLTLSRASELYRSERGDGSCFVIWPYWPSQLR